jgi:hypothetical protein
MRRRKLATRENLVRRDRSVGSKYQQEPVSVSQQSRVRAWTVSGRVMTLLPHARASKAGFCYNTRGACCEKRDGKFMGYFISEGAHYIILPVTVILWLFVVMWRKPAKNSQKSWKQRGIRLRRKGGKSAEWHGCNAWYRMSRNDERSRFSVGEGRYSFSVLRSVNSSEPPRQTQYFRLFDILLQCQVIFLYLSFIFPWFKDVFVYNRCEDWKKYLAS